MSCRFLARFGQFLKLTAGLGAAILGGATAIAFASDSYRLLSDSRQVIYLNGVPHTDRHGALRLAVGTDSFFPRCGYATLPDALAGLKSAGFNCFHPWNGLSLDETVAEADRSGMQLVKELLVKPCSYREEPGCDPESNAAVQIARIVGEVAAHAEDPGVLAWYLEEEVTGCSHPPSNCPERISNYRRLRAAIKQVDPAHPSFNLEYSVPSSAPPWLNELTADGDVMVFDDYPFHKGNESTLEVSAMNMARLVELGNQRKPIWLTVQAFEQPASMGTPWKLPSPVQVRAQVFAGIVHGATGILYFASDSPVVRAAHVIGIASSTPARYGDDTPSDVVASDSQIAASRMLWNAVVRLNGELQRLQSAILSPTSSMKYTVSVAGRAFSATPIRALLKQSDSHYTLLVVNIDDAPLKMRIVLPRSPEALSRIDADGNVLPVVSQGVGIDDSIEGFGVRVYQFD